MDYYVEMGKIVNTHGILGEVKVQSYGDSPESLMEYDFYYIGKAKNKIEVKNARIHKGHALMILDGISDIDSAARLKNQMLYLKRSELLPPSEGSYYLTDLEGITAYLEGGLKLGMVKEVLQTGGSDIFVIVGENKKEYLIPFRAEFVKDIDLEGKSMIVTPIEGLLEL